MDLIIVNHILVIRTTSELDSSSSIFHITPTGRRLSLDIFNVHRPPIDGLYHKCQLVGLEIAFPPCKPKVEGWILAGIDKFPGCENHRHACHMIMWHVKNPPSINFALMLSATWGRGSLLVKFLDCGWVVASPSPVPLKTRRAGERCTLNLPTAQTFSFWCGS
ncbi:hypothetical protein TNCV_2014791 [Trichonephila clavipes]|nr:hypothetical protein TNCV_2014791 [Trichonephila clavipes]